MTRPLLMSSHCCHGTVTPSFCHVRHLRPCQHVCLFSTSPLHSCLPFCPLDPSFVLLPYLHRLLRFPLPPHAPLPQRLCCPFPSGSPTSALPSLGAPCSPGLALPSLCPQCPHSGRLQTFHGSLTVPCTRGAESTCLVPLFLRPQWAQGWRRADQERPPSSQEPLCLGGRAGPSLLSQSLAQSRHAV